MRRYSPQHNATHTACAAAGPDETVDQIRSFLCHRRPHFRETHRKQIIGLLSPALRAELARHTHAVWVHHVPFLSCENASPAERERFVCEVGRSLAVAADQETTAWRARVVLLNRYERSHCVHAAGRTPAELI